MDCKRLGIRWTMGDVSDFGYEALRCSVWGAYQLFGADAAYAVCVNTVPVSEVQRRAAPLPRGIRWVEATQAVPSWLLPHLSKDFAEGVAWKFAPLQMFPDRWELALDNDCILWRLPEAIRTWLNAPEPCAVVAEDVRACFGQFSEVCGDAPRNMGIRGLPPGVDLEAALRNVLREHPVEIRSELDEQGLQLAALYSLGDIQVVSCNEVSICSPFPPHVRWLGSCGAHFCGLNAKRLSFELEGRPGEEHVRDHWLRHRATVAARVGLARSDHLTA